MSDFFELVRTRRSIRHFLPDPLGEEQRRTVLEAALRAPSAGNLQAYEIAAVEERGRRRALARASWQEFVGEAPLLLVFCALPKRSSGRYGARGTRLYCVQDATIACAYAQLAADALQLGSVWIGAFDDSAVARAVDAPPGALPVAILAVGQRAERGEVSGRRPLSEVVRTLR
jgi:nitroreductase